MTEYIDVPVGEIKPGDEVRVDGYGKIPCAIKAEPKVFEDCALEWRSVFATWHSGFSILIGESGKRLEVKFRRSSIVAARRRVEKVEENKVPIINRCTLTGCGNLTAQYCDEHAKGANQCNSTELPKPKIEDPICAHRDSAWVWYCSLKLGHEGNHRAYGMHDQHTPLLSEWPPEPEPIKAGTWDCSACQVHPGPGQR